MQQKLLLSIVVFLAIHTLVFGQVPPPCPNNNFPGATSCQQACVYCDFDGYMGNNSGTPSGGNLVCGQITIHNDQWFGFVAGSTSITIDVATSNCQNGDGLQAAFFDSCDGDALDCNPGTAGGAGLPLTLTYSNFVPGQTYFLMIDGYIADVCDYQMNVTSGSVSPPPPGAPPVPVGPTAVCPGATVEYTIPPVSGAGYYRWIAPPGSQINGGASNVQFPAPEGTTVTITFGSVGGNVCVQVGNACYPAQQSCLPVTNQPIPPTILEPVTVCFEDAPFIWDQEPFTSLAAPGTFTLNSSPYMSYLGCDSTVRQTITIKNQIITNIGTQYICENSCFTINGADYCNPGTFSETFTSFLDCDSIVRFTVVQIPNDAIINPVPGIISCTNPTVTLSSSSTGPGTTFNWKNSMGNTIGTQNSVGVNAGGQYSLIVGNTIGGTTCYDTAFVTVQQDISLPNISTQGGTLTCFPGGATVTLQGNSTTPGVTYLWSGPGITPGNQNQQNPTVGMPGTYILQVTNPANSCVAVDSAIVIGDNTPPTVSITADTITCTQASTILNSTTNASTATYQWTGPGITPANQADADPSVVMAGLYNLTVTNSISGCTNTASISVIGDTQAPIANAGNDGLLTCDQPSINLTGTASPNGVTFLWTGPGITPANQNDPMPNVNQAGTYILTVTNPANGCTHSDTALVDASLTPPSVDAGQVQTITCATTSVTLGGNGSSQGPEFEALWTGPGINAGNQNQYNPVVDQSGTYTMTITNTNNGCTASNSVTIDLDTAIPTVSSGPDQTLTCLTPNGVTLDGSGMPNTITFLWSGPGIDAGNETLPNPQVSQAGDYILVVTNPTNGCTQTDTTVVFQDANVPVANAGPNLNLSCAVTSVDINGSGSSSGQNFVYQWTGPGITPATESMQSPTGITVPGTYNLIVTDTTNSCENTDVVLITIDTLAPVANGGNDLVLNCYNSATETLDASASSAGANFTVLWSGPGINAGNQNNTQVAVSLAGMYDLLVTNTTNGCTATDQVLVTDDLATPTADAGNDQIIDCVITSTVIGGTSSSGPTFTYDWTGPGINAGNQTLAQPNVAVSGTYTLLVTDTSNGCTATDDVVVNLNATYPTASAGPDLVLTCAMPMQTLDGSASSNGANFQTLWTGPDINAGNQNSLSPTITQPGTYILSITDQNNSCVTADTVVVQENKVAPTASAGLDLGLDCQITQVALDGSGSTTGPDFIYLWTGPGITPANQNDQSPTVNAPGNYTLLVTDTNNGCTATDAADISQDIALPTASAGQPFTLTCTQPTLPIDGSGSSVGANFEYLWTGPGINSSNLNLQNPMVADSGTYTLLVTNTQNHCTSTDMVIVSADQDLPVTSAGIDQTLTCQNDTLDLDGTGSQAGATIVYTWSGPGIVAGTQASATAQVFLPGNYTLEVLNTANGCSNTDAVNIGQDIQAPIADAGADAILTCTSASGISLSALGSDTGAGFSLLWSGPGISAANQNQVEPTVAVSGTYTVLITNTNNGCTSTDEVMVGLDQDLPTADAGLDQTITCSVPQVMLDAGGSLGNAPLTYAWSGPGITAGNADLISPAVNQSGVYTVVVTNTVNGCTDMADVEVFLDTDPPQAGATGGLITCMQPEISIASTSSVAGSTYSWSGPDIDVANMNLQNPQVGEPGVYTVLITAPNGCTATATAQVDIDADVPVGTTTGTELNCTNNGQSSISGTVSTPGATFAWTGPNGFMSTNLNPQVSAAGTYFLTLTSVNGCTKTYDAVVTANFTQPTVKATVGDKLDCTTTSVIINGNGSSAGPAYSYTWTTGNGNIVSGGNTLTPTVDMAGVYTLQVTNSANGCTNTGTVTVEYDPAVPTGFDLTVKQIRCFGETNGFIAINSVIGGTQPFQFTFNGGPASGTGQFSQLSQGTYVIALEDANGCTLDTAVAITAPGALTVDLEDNVLLQLGESVTVTATITGTTPIESITWNPPAPCITDCLSYDTLPTHSYQQTITVVDSNGCISTDRQIIQVDRSRRIYVPNVFNPGSSDPLNSFLMIQGGTDVRQIKNWQIFDRWGNAIFSANDFQPNDPTYAWNGKARGDDAASAVYVWYVEVEFIDGEVELFKGDVTLVRN